MRRFERRRQRPEGPGARERLSERARLGVERLDQGVDVSGGARGALEGTERGGGRIAAGDDRPSERHGVASPRRGDAERGEFEGARRVGGVVLDAGGQGLGEGPGVPSGRRPAMNPERSRLEPTPPGGVLRGVGERPRVKSCCTFVVAEAVLGDVRRARQLVGAVDGVRGRARELFERLDLGRRVAVRLDAPGERRAGPGVRRSDRERLAGGREAVDGRSQVGPLDLGAREPEVGAQIGGGGGGDSRCECGVDPSPSPRRFVKSLHHAERVEVLGSSTEHVFCHREGAVAVDRGQRLGRADTERVGHGFVAARGRLGDEGRGAPGAVPALSRGTREAREGGGVRRFGPNDRFVRRQRQAGIAERVFLQDGHGQEVRRAPVTVGRVVGGVRVDRDPRPCRVGGRFG